MYVVGRGRLKVGDGYREVGDPIPEAADWTNLRAYLQSGLVRSVDDAGAEWPEGPGATAVTATAADAGEAAPILPPPATRRHKRA